MFATLEEKLIVSALSALVIVVGIFGFIHHERSEGAAVCVQQQSNAAKAEVKQDDVDNKNVVADFTHSLDAIPITASHTPTLLMCSAPSRVREVPSTTGAKPAAPADSDSGSRVQTGDSPRVDIGPAVQDITYASLLCSADLKQLWNLAVKESNP
jgi:hypothetical protein